MHKRSELLVTVFKADAYKVANRVILRRKLVVTAHLSVFEDADMILMSKAVSAPKTHKLVRILPRDKVISESLFDEERDEIAYRMRGVKRPDEEILSAGLFHLWEHASQ